MCVCGKKKKKKEIIVNSFKSDNDILVIIFFNEIVTDEITSGICFKISQGWGS